VKNIIKIWILGFVAILSFTILVHDAIGQEISFYDRNWNLTTKENAQFYYVTIDNIPICRIGTIEKYNKRLEKHKQKFSRKINKEIGEKKIYEIDFSDSEYDSIYLGKKVKVFFNGEYYDYLCRSASDSIDWPSDEIKNKSGVCFEKWKAPKDGEFGIIVWQFRDFKSSTDKTVFLIKIEDYYIPITGQALTMIDKFSSNEIEIIKAKEHPKRYLIKKNKIGQI
jgi:hypothetical protein